MKKIEFGFNGDDKLNATWSEIEFYNGEYLCTVSCNGENFLVTRIVDSNKGLNGQIDVREVIQDYYIDGSYLTYANKEKTILCRKMEEYLNKEKIRVELKENNVLEKLREAGFPAYTSHLPKIESDTEEFAEIVTSIRPEIFKKLKDSKKTGFGISMYYMAEEIKKLREEIETLKAENNEIRAGKYR